MEDLPVEPIQEAKQPTRAARFPLFAKQGQVANSSRPTASPGSTKQSSAMRPKSVNTRSSKVLEGLVWAAVVLIVLTVIGFGVWGEIRLANIVETPELPINGAPTESPVIADTTEGLDSGEYRQTLQEIYQQNLESGNSIAAVDQAVQDKINAGGDKNYVAQVRLTEIELMNANSNYDRALELLGGFTAEELELAERARYYAALSEAHQALANFDLANEYARLAHETEKALGAER